MFNEITIFTPIKNKIYTFESDNSLKIYETNEL